MKIHINQKRVKDYQDVDHINNLPNGIRCHILSFIPTKSALKMSVLSKQWKHLWTQFSVLNFSEMPHSYMDGWGLTSQQITHYKNIVHKVLVHNDGPFLQFLDLDLGDFGWDDNHCMKSWLDIIAKRDIHEIEITCICGDKPLVALPTNFLSRERLVALTLHGKFSIDDKMLSHLPNLEFVHFTGLQIPNDEFLMRMLSGCLVLKDLTIAYCTGINISLFVEPLSPRRLRMWSITRATKRVGIVIRTPSLRYLHLDDTLKQHVVVDLSSLDGSYLRLKSVDYSLKIDILDLL